MKGLLLTTLLLCVVGCTNRQPAPPVTFYEPPRVPDQFPRVYSFDPLIAVRNKIRGRPDGGCVINPALCPDPKNPSTLTRIITRPVGGPIGEFNSKVPDEGIRDNLNYVQSAGQRLVAAGGKDAVIKDRRDCEHMLITAVEQDVERFGILRGLDYYFTTQHNRYNAQLREASIGNASFTVTDENNVALVFSYKCVPPN